MHIKELNDINDDDSLFTLKDALDGAIIVVVDDARTYRCN